MSGCYTECLTAELTNLVYILFNTVRMRGSVATYIFRVPFSTQITTAATSIFGISSMRCFWKCLSILLYILKGAK